MNEVQLEKILNDGTVLLEAYYGNRSHEAEISAVRNDHHSFLEKDLDRFYLVLKELFPSDSVTGITILSGRRGLPSESC